MSSKAISLLHLYLGLPTVLLHSDFLSNLYINIIPIFFFMLPVYPIVPDFILKLLVKHFFQYAILHTLFPQGRQFNGVFQKQ